MCECPCHTTPVTGTNVYQYCEECCDGDPTDTNITIKLGELMILVSDLDKALALQRGGGSPITTHQYIRLRQRVKDATFNCQDLIQRFGEL
jgi:hypothetical protein